MLACGTPDAVDRYRQAKQASSPDGPGGKNWVWEEFVQGGELLTSAGDIVGRWKKYFEDLLNPTDLPSNEEAEDGDSEVDSSITQAEVTEVVLGTGECVPTTEGSHFSASREGLRQGTGEENRPIGGHPRIQEEQCGFRPGRGTVDPALYPPQGARGFMEFAQPVHVCGSGEGIRPCPSWYSVESAPRVWGPGAFAKGCSVSVDRSRSLVRIAGSKSDLFPVMLDSGRAALYDVVLLASSSQDLQHVLERFAAECEAAGIESAPPNPRPWYSTGKGWCALSG
ncbi:hypothetical protein L3Q82_017335 [Scortum barcoo]|uniref:Uncharacterized protein n=1 Tax=Scortum barcoo TaxID=214431 RepID=A0ACB8VKX3_9TELE|nr:hypothetical protein L3Q82_017335 [Scortum barcoo]